MSTPDDPALNDRSLQDLAAAYALGALTPDEARRFEAYLAAAPEAQRELNEYREATALLAAGTLPAEPPSPDLRDRVLTAAAPRSAGGRGLRSFLWGALAASAVAAIGLGLQSQSLARRLASSDSLLVQQQDKLVTQETALQQQAERLQRLEGTLASIFSPGTQLVQLTATGDPDPRIQLFWDRRRNLAVLHGAKLKPPAAGHTYQLWFIQDGKPVPSVTFNVEQGGEATVPQVTVPADGRISAVAVTEEPAGGSHQPTSPILLAAPFPKS